MNSKKQSVAIITGGNSGISRAIAEAFVHQDSQVSIVGRNKDTLAATSEALGNDTVWYQVDVSKGSEVTSFVEKIVQKFSKVDVLINAAGFMHTTTTTMSLSDAENLWDEVLDVNLKGSFLMSVAIAAYLARPGGRIINISSIGSFTGGSRAGGLAYTSSKAEVNGLTFALAAAERKKHAPAEKQRSVPRNRNHVK